MSSVSKEGIWKCDLSGLRYNCCLSTVLFKLCLLATIDDLFHSLYDQRPKKPGPIKVMLVFTHGFKLCMQATLDDLIFGFYDQRPNKHRSGAFTGNFVVRVVHGLFNFCIQAAYWPPSMTCFMASKIKVQTVDAAAFLGNFGSIGVHGTSDSTPGSRSERWRAFRAWRCELY